MTFLSLFSGIGGLDLGLERAGMRCVGQVEIDPFCRKVLEKHWPNVRRWDDIETFEPDDSWKADLICGGFPCQPVSVAGKRLGDADERWLWPQFFRIVRVLEPNWVLVENVPGLLSASGGRLFGGILRDLAACGYCAEWDCLPAAAFGAHFRGDRLFIVANRSAASVMRRKGKWENPSRAFSRNEFTRLVEQELRLCVPAGKAQRISDGISGRVDRLRGIGNAVVPQVSEWIGRRIMSVS